VSDTVYLNGQFLAGSEAKISVFDRGFLFADSVYEVIPFYQGIAFQLNEHLARLERSLAQLNILTDVPFAQLASELVERNGGGNQSVYIQVSRGADIKRSHIVEKKLQPTIFICTHAITNSYALDADDVLPVKVVVCEDIRWQRCDIKSTSLLGNIIMLEQAREKKAAEALLERDGYIQEGASSSLFIVEAGSIIAPQSSNTVLQGTTSTLIQRLAQDQKIAFLNEAISYQRLLSADEVWVSSSTRGLLPVSKVGEKSIGTVSKGPLWHRLYLLLASHQAQLEAQP